jgi:hypothetical protein
MHVEVEVSHVAAGEHMVPGPFHLFWWTVNRFAKSSVPRFPVKM